MSEELPVYQMLYVSRLMPGSGYSVVNDIVSVSRRTNAQRDITGALVFDGECFGQLIEGRKPDVIALMQRIETDPRHTDIRLLFSGVTGPTRRTRVWRSGYCEAQQLEMLMADAAHSGPAALAAFMSILDTADVE
ncbi:MAG: BLUF domain-containing protein [Burkholderiales bacterium]